MRLAVVAMRTFVGIVRGRSWGVDTVQPHGTSLPTD